MDQAIIKKIVVGQLQTNCYIVNQRNHKGCAVIDPGDEYPKIKAFIDSMGLEAKTIINTHGHADHIAANDDFGLPVLIHSLDEDFLFSAEKNLSLFHSQAFISKVKTKKLQDGDSIELNDLIFKVIHTPGHTPGGICLKLGKVLFSGDTLFAEGVGRTDFAYGNEQDLFDSIHKKLLTLDPDTKVLPGHGPSTTIGREKEYLFSGYL